MDTLPGCNSIPGNETISGELLIELPLIELVFKGVETNLFVGFFLYH